MEPHARTTTPTVAVIGAGLAGLTAGRRLADAGLDVSVFEKSRGMGGRMSTRRRDGLAFDHGAQYFTARTPEFRQAVESWVEAGAACPWDVRVADILRGVVRERPRLHARFIGLPAMNAVCKFVGAGLAVRPMTRVVSIEAAGRAWALAAEDGTNLGAFDIVLSSAPPVQTQALLTGAPGLAAAIEPARMAPCWAWMAVFEAPLGLPYGAARVEDGVLAWIANNASKPGRPASGMEAWVAHASPAWSAAHAEDPPEQVRRELSAAFAETTGSATVPHEVMVHRWLYAQTTTPIGAASLWDADLRLGVCGDWLCGATVESAWRSGSALAAYVLASLE